MNKKNILFICSGLFIVLITAILIFYRVFFGVNVQTETGESIIYIPTGSGYEQVMDSLAKHLVIKNIKVLNWVAEKKKYPELIKPGRYEIKNGLGYIELINLLRSGRQVPVDITFSNARTLNEIAGKFGSKIEADSLDILNFLLNESNFLSDGFRKENIIALFIPNTYEIYWNSDARTLYNRMLKEHRRFWNEDRLKKAKDKNLSPLEVAALSSIIDCEVSKDDEKPKIAGVYLNRLKSGIPLQADPTIKFALNNFAITRVLKKNLEVDSPYNTYKHTGLPPGPIVCPSVTGIDAVLNAEKHDYLFFVAKSDFSGYHNFSRTLTEHNHYAFLYQKELNKRRIFK